jgi:hypothetical protein
MSFLKIRLEIIHHAAAHVLTMAMSKCPMHVAAAVVAVAGATLLIIRGVEVRIKQIVESYVLESYGTAACVYVCVGAALR